MSTTRSQKRKNDQQSTDENVSEGLISPIVVRDSCPLNQDDEVAGPSRPKSPRIENSLLESLRASLKEEITSEIKNLLIESQKEMLKLLKPETKGVIRENTEEVEEETRSFYTPTKSVRISSTQNDPIICRNNDAHINTNIDFTINHVFKSMTVQELNTLHTICELERTQLLTILAMSVKNPQLAGFLLTGNRSNFLYVEGSTAWLYDCPHFISPLYKADKCFDRIPIHYRETIIYVDPITRQTFNYATPIECGNNPQNKIELDPDSNDGDFYVLTPEPLKREALQMFKPTQIKTTITPITFTAQDAGIYSNAELDQFWNRVLFAKHSDTTLQLLGKSLSYDFISMHNEKHSYSGHNPYNHLRIGVHDHLLNLLPLFNPDWFSQAFINFFGYPCYVLTQCGISFSTFLFIREVLTFLLKFYRTISIKYNLQSNISILSSIAHGFFNIVTSEMVTDLNNTGKRKRIYTKHKITTSENDNILLPEKEKTINEDTLILTPLIYLLNIPVRTQHFNHRKRHTQLM